MKGSNTARLLKSLNFVTISYRVTIILLLITTLFSTAKPFSKINETTVSESGSASANRLWSSGAELQSATNGVEFQSIAGTASATTISTSTKRSGDASYRVNTSAQTSIIYSRFASTNQSSAFWFRTYIYFSSLPDGYNGLLCATAGSPTAYKICVYYIQSSSKLQLYNAEDAVSIATGSTTITTSTWYRLELYVNTTTLSSTTSEMRINGVTEASGTSNLTAGVMIMAFGSNNNSTADMYFDDLAVNGNSARSDNWPGEGKIVHMNPDSDGDNVAWTASSGSDYQTVDETTPNDGTDYIEATANPTTEDLNLESSSTVGIASTDYIKLTQVGYRFKTCTDDLGTCDLEASTTDRLRIKASASGTVEESSNLTRDTALIHNTNTTDQETYQLTTYDLPGSSTVAWQASNLDTTQIGVVHASTARTRVSTIWLLVEYIPRTGGRLISSGAELQSVTAGVEVDAITGSPEISTSIYRSGAASFKLTTTLATELLQYRFATTNQQGVYYFRVYMRATTLPAGNRTLAYFADTSSNAKIGIVLYSTGKVQLYNIEDSTGIGSQSSGTVSSTDWTRLEVKIDTTTLASTSAELRMDGATVGSGTADLTAGVGRVIMGSGSAAESIEYYFDDIAVNAGLGTNQSTWPGSGSIFHLNPNAAGDNSAWTNTYTNIDETTPNDATDSVTETTTGDILDVNLANSSLSSTAAVSLVSVGARFRTSGATQEDFKVRLKDTASGATIESDTLSPASTTWVSNQTADPRKYPLTAYTRPDVDGAWNDTYLDSAQIGVRDTGGSGTVEVTALWLLVEYVSGVNITGTIYTDEGSTAYNCSSDNLTIEVAVAGGTTESTTCTAAGGTYAITTTAAPAAADPIAVWINSAETPKATAVTMATSGMSSLSGMNLYQNMLIVRHEDSGPITNSKLSTADNANAGIRYSVSAGNLTVESGISLYVWGSKTFTPGGTVTTNVTGGDVKINTSGTLSMGGNALSIGGSYTNSGTFTSGSNTTTFTSTATGKTLNGTMTGSSAFYALVFNGSGGGWTLGAAIAATNNLTITAGTLDTSSGNNYAITIGGSYSNSGTFTARSGTVTFNSTATGKTLGGTMTGSSAFYDLVFNGSGGGWTFNAAVTATNDFTVSNGAVAGNGNNLTVTRDFTLDNTTGVSYTPGTSTVAISRHYNDSGNKFVEGTTSIVTLNGTGTATFTGDFSTLNIGYTSFTTTLPNNSFQITSSLTFNGGTVTGGGSSGIITLPCSANCTPVVFNSATTLNGTETLIYKGTVNGITITVAGNDYGSWDINPYASFEEITSSIWQLNGNLTTTGNLRFDAETLATPTFTTTGSNYTVTAGVLQMQPVTANRTGSWTLNLNASNTSFTSTSSSITVGSDSTHTINMGSGTMTVYGNVQLLNTGGSITLSAGTSTLKWAHTSGTKTFTPNSQSLYNLTLDASGGTVQPAGAVDVNNDFTITNGTYDTVTGSNYALTVGRHLANSGTFTANSATVTLDGSVEQNITGTWTTTSAFYNLTVTNSSGASASDCERTGFTPSIDFDAAATVTNNLVFTTANTRIEFNSGSTYTFTNINWNGQASGTKIYFRNSAETGTWLLNVSGTQTAVSYINVSRSDASGGNTIVANNGTNTNCNNNTNWNFSGNTAPNSPSSLVQYKSNGTTVLATGDWTNETTVVFKATVSDTDNPDTLYLCYEVDLIANAFSNTEDGCGSSVSYAGTPLTASATVSGLANNSEYHWQVRVKDAANEYSAWVSYGGNAESARDFGTDTSAPSTNNVYDGTTVGVDATYNDGSLTSVSANWDAFNSDVSGLNKYEYSIGTTAGATDIKTWTNNSTTTSVTATSLVLNTGQLYFFNVRATDNATNVSNVVSSNGQTVLPEISMSISSNTLTFDLLTSSNNRSDTKTTTLTTSTNAYGGYVIRAYASGLLTSGAYTIPMFSAGSYAAPATWPAGACSGTTCGYGYTSSDTTIQGSNIFAGATKYAPFSTTSPGDIVADHTDAVNGTTGKVVSEEYTITHKIAVDALQRARSYQTVIYYIVSATF
ncbi:hypothetical protein HY844_00425 [Candidatus Berkelbacteria bacterium]|nr:hypothetical protein [Candidatus Berkelbacteria bacterium]